MRMMKKIFLPSEKPQLFIGKRKNSAQYCVFYSAFSHKQGFLCHSLKKKKLGTGRSGEK